MRPCVIGIGGFSGAGKSTLADALKDALTSASILSLDSYYHEREDLSLAERKRCNFDHPDALDWNLIGSQVAALSEGVEVDRPQYSFITYSRAPEPVRVLPGQFVIVEGILALHNAVVRSLLDIKIFVNTADHVCFARRKVRDVNERGRPLQSVVEQYTQTVRPMAVEYVLPSMKYADIVVSGETSPQEAIATIQFAARAVLLYRPQKFPLEQKIYRSLFSPMEWNRQETLLPDGGQPISPSAPDHHLPTPARG